MRKYQPELFTGGPDPIPGSYRYWYVAVFESDPTLLAKLRSWNTHVYGHESVIIDGKWALYHICDKNGHTDERQNGVTVEHVFDSRPARKDILASFTQAHCVVLPYDPVTKDFYQSKPDPAPVSPPNEKTTSEDEEKANYMTLCPTDDPIPEITINKPAKKEKGITLADWETDTEESTESDCSSEPHNLEGLDGGILDELD